MTLWIPMTPVVVVFTILQLVASETSTVYPGDTCKVLTCKNGGSCLIDGSGNVECACAIGYTGTSCDEDINECPTKCYQLNTVCRNFPGGFRCDCINDYEGDSPESKPCSAINKDETGSISILIFCGIAGVLLITLIGGMTCFFCWKKDKPAGSAKRVKVFARPSLEQRELRKVSYVEERRSSLYDEAPEEVPEKNLTAVRPSTKRRSIGMEKPIAHQAHTAQEAELDFTDHGDGKQCGSAASTMSASSKSGETQTSHGFKPAGTDSPDVLGDIILSVDTLTATSDSLFPAELGDSLTDLSVAVSRSVNLKGKRLGSEGGGDIGHANKTRNGKEGMMFYI
ncbi:protein eyes shut homolog [Lineus longissimus]|uniref:protein eyes shut homolog n=1 Tax=Lineus longissimus TaxID=88925 RepID=UPI00315D705F